MTNAYFDLGEDELTNGIFGGLYADPHDSD